MHIILARVWLTLTLGYNVLHAMYTHLAAFGARFLFG
jgi:hypothetical protein